MSRYRGSRIKVVRRLGILPGFTTKIINKKSKNYLNSKKLSQYSLHLREKQKLRYNYGINEHQLVRYIELARKIKGNAGNILLQLLEMRLDTILFKSGLVPTIISARQLISHGHIFIEGKKVTIPSYNCKISNKIIIKISSLNQINFNSFINTSSNHLQIMNTSDIVQITIKNNVDLQLLDFFINILLVLEYYSDK